MSQGSLLDVPGMTEFDLGGLTLGLRPNEGIAALDPDGHVLALAEN